MRAMHAIFLVAALSSCARWSHPTASEAQFYRDSYDCNIGSGSAFPVNNTAMGVDRQGPGRVNCSTFGNQTNCTTTQGAYIPAPMIDVNAFARAMAFDSCMRGKGYTK